MIVYKRTSKGNFLRRSSPCTPSRPLYIEKGRPQGAALLMAFVGKESGLGANALFKGNIWLSLAIEVILTFVFVLAILGVTSKVENGAVAGVVIGLTLTLVHILGISFTGTSVNPARSFGPALFVGGDALANVWVFIVAPLVGGALAALVYNSWHLRKRTDGT